MTGRPLLTPRQREVLAWTAQGDSQKQVARRLGLSEHTIKNHLTAIFARLGARTVAHAVYLAFGAGAEEIAA